MHKWSNPENLQKAVLNSLTPTEKLRKASQKKVATVIRSTAVSSATLPRNNPLPEAHRATAALQIASALT